MSINVAWMSLCLSLQGLHRQESQKQLNVHKWKLSLLSHFGKAGLTYFSSRKAAKRLGTVIWYSAPRGANEEKERSIRGTFKDSRHLCSASRLLTLPGKQQVKTAH